MKIKEIGTRPRPYAIKHLEEKTVACRSNPPLPYKRLIEGPAINKIATVIVNKIVKLFVKP